MTPAMNSLLGIVLVLGAELNAFLERPVRSAAVTPTPVPTQPVRADAGQPQPRVGLAGRIVGGVALIVAARLLRDQVVKTSDERAAA